MKRFCSSEGELSSVCQQIIKTLILNSHKFKKVTLCTSSGALRPWLPPWEIPNFMNNVSQHDKARTLEALQLDVLTLVLFSRYAP